MKYVNIPFNRKMVLASLSGQKRMTTRTKKYGDPGDRFILAGHEFEIIAVMKLPLKEVAQRFFRYEGFRSNVEFIEFWNKTYPKMSYEQYKDKEFYVHVYKRVKPLTMQG